MKEKKNTATLNKSDAKKQKRNTVKLSKKQDTNKSMPAKGKAIRGNKQEAKKTTQSITKRVGNKKPPKKSIRKKVY